MPESPLTHAFTGPMFQRQERVDFDQQLFMHAPNMHALACKSTETPRIYVRASVQSTLYNSRMGVTWQDRLKAAWAFSGLSMRKASKMARLGDNYLSQAFKSQGEPRLGDLDRIARTLNVPTGWILSGLPASNELDELTTITTGMEWQDAQAAAEQFRMRVQGSKSLALPAPTTDFESDADGLETDASGSSIDLELFKEAHDLAIQYEQRLSGTMQSAEKRMELVKFLYDQLRKDRQIQT